MSAEEAEKSQVILRLYEKQAETDKRISSLREEFFNVIEEIKIRSLNEDDLNKIKGLYGRMDNVEKDVEATKQSIEMISRSLTTLTQNVGMVNTSIGDLKTQQGEDNKLLYTTQKDMISSLWKAFFMVLGIVVTIGTGIFYLMRG